MKKLFVLLLSLLLCAFPSPVSADESWIIESFQSDISIQQSGTVHVKETIHVDFKSTEKHGIFRDIPFKYNSTDGGKHHTEVTNIHTGSDQKNVEKEGDFINIRIGDPDRTFSGKKTYTIEYDVIGVLRGFENHDELYWNVTGNYWEVPIQKVYATVRLDGGIITGADCYYGALGSNQTCNVDHEADSVRYQITNLSAQDGMTIVASYPKGITQLPVVKSFGEKLLSPYVIGLFIAVLGGGIAFIFWLWYMNGRDFILRGKHLFDKHAKPVAKPLGHKHTIVAEYTPPEDLRPAEIGVLTDERADTLDVTATIIDLATRGYLSITEIEKKWMFGSVDYSLTKKSKDTKELLNYERKLFTELFKSGDTVKVSELKKTFYTELKKVKDQLYKDVVTKNLFAKNPESVRGTYMAIAIVIIILFGSVFFFSLGLENPWLFSVTVAMVLNGINMLVVAQVMPRRTGYGDELYRRVKGYQLFIGNVEKHRQQFFEKKNMFNIVLPYAIVFGLTEKFAKGLEKIGYKPNAATWYHGTRGFSITHFESQVSAFSGSISSAIASTPSSSGSGGGGSSGGGFGGGGGGSW